MQNKPPAPHIPKALLTVVIRDDAPFSAMQEAPKKRAVRIELTEEQCRELALHYTYSWGYGEGQKWAHEEISTAILEDVKADV